MLYYQICTEVEICTFFDTDQKFDNFKNLDDYLQKFNEKQNSTPLQSLASRPVAPATEMTHHQSNETTKQRCKEVHVHRFAW